MAAVDSNPEISQMFDSQDLSNMQNIQQINSYIGQLSNKNQSFQRRKSLNKTLISQRNYDGHTVPR